MLWEILGILWTLIKAWVYVSGICVNVLSIVLLFVVIYGLHVIKSKWGAK
jgi:hypothetical protein